MTLHIHNTADIPATRSLFLYRFVVNISLIKFWQHENCSSFSYCMFSFSLLCIDTLLILLLLSVKFLFYFVDIKALFHCAKIQTILNKLNIEYSIVFCKMNSFDVFFLILLNALEYVYLSI